MLSQRTQPVGSAVECYGGLALAHQGRHFEAWAKTNLYVCLTNRLLGDSQYRYLKTDETDLNVLCPIW